MRKACATWPWQAMVFFHREGCDDAADMRALMATLVVLAVLALMVRLLESSMAFYPTRGVQETPALANLPFEDLRIPTGDGETLHAWWLEHPQPRAQVV